MIEQKVLVNLEVTDEVKAAVAAIRNIEEHLSDIQQGISEMFDKYGITNVQVKLTLAIDKDKLFKVQ